MLRELWVWISKEELGGHEIHLKSGVVDNLAEDEEDALIQIKSFLSYLPDNCFNLPPINPVILLNEKKMSFYDNS